MAKHDPKTNPDGVTPAELQRRQDEERRVRPSLMARLVLAVGILSVVLIAGPTVTTSAEPPAATAAAQPPPVNWELEQAPDCGPGMRAEGMHCVVTHLGGPQRPSWFSGVVMGALGVAGLVGLLIVG